MKTSRFCLALLLSAAPLVAFAQSDPLQPLSRSELGRVFGTTPTPPSERTIDGALVQSLRQSDPIAALDDLRQRSNAATVDSNVLLNLLQPVTPPQPGDPETALRYLLLWHQIALDLTAIDHAPVGANEVHQQFGPARTARALALVHQAMFEAAAQFSNNRYESTLPDLGPLDASDASMEAAIIEAAYQTLGWLYPRLRVTPIHTSAPVEDAVTLPAVAAAAAPISDTRCPDQPSFSLQNYYFCSLATIADADAREKGARIGRAIAGEVRRMRAGDMANVIEPEFGAADDRARFQPLYPEGTPNRAFQQWLQDPVSKLAIALGGNWTEVAPFAMSSAYAYRPSEVRAPIVQFPAVTGDPAVDQQNLLEAVKSLKSYNAIEKWGGDARLNNGGRMDQDQPSKDGFFVAQLWAYDATAYLCAPARLYNQVAIAVLRQIAATPTTDPARAGRAPLDTRRTVDVARYLALVNFAMADAALAAWDAKFHFQSPRPVTYVRAVKALEAATTPAATPPATPPVTTAPATTGEVQPTPAVVQEQEGDELDKALGDPQPMTAAATVASPPLPQGAASTTLWFPTGAQVTNSDNPVNITPPFPAYVSGHAAFGGALFGILRQFTAPDTEFAFLSDEFNGKNKDVYNYIRCEQDSDGAIADEYTPHKFCVERTFTLDCAERENADSRLWMGVHWIHDADDGITMGNQVARDVFGKMMRPRSGGLNSQPFSVQAGDYQGENPRTALTCDGLDLPAGWDDANDPQGLSGFGELVLVDVPPAQ
jgi:hypothetical protein